MLRYFASGPVSTNTYLIFCPSTRRGAIIDVPFGSADQWVQWTAEHQIIVEMILLTHSHWDHIAEAAILQEQLNVPIYIHEEDQGNLQKPGQDRLPRPKSFKGVEPGGFLTDGQTIELGTLSLQVIHTPGHTPGGVCFYLPTPPHPLLISGDTLFRGSIGNLSFPTACPDRMWISLKKLAMLPPETAVYPGHGEATTIQEEQKNIKEILSSKTQRYL